MRVSALWRHPIKGHGVEAVDGGDARRRARRCPGTGSGRSRTRRREVAPGSRAWAPCANFGRGAKSPELMAIRAEVDEARGRVRLTHPRRAAIERRSRRSRGRGAAGRLGDAARRPAAGRCRPSWCGRDVGMTDSDFPSIVGAEPGEPRRARASGSGRPLAMERFRGNVWLEGLAPFARVRPRRAGDPRRRGGAGGARADHPLRRDRRSIPIPGSSDADTLGGLEAGWGHRDFGVYAEVVAGGRVAVGDAAAVL